MVDAYQTLEDRDNIDHVEASGPFICERPDAWLGTGYYFWDTNMEWAIEWGINSYEKKNKAFIIAKCKVDINNNCFDLLGSVFNQYELKEVMNAFIESEKVKDNQRLILPNIIQYMKNKGIFKYKSIRAADITNKVITFHFSKDERKREFMEINQRVQICVIANKEVVLPPFTVIYPEIYIT